MSDTSVEAVRRPRRAPVRSAARVLLVEDDEVTPILVQRAADRLGARHLPQRGSAPCRRRRPAAGGLRLRPARPRSAGRGGHGCPATGPQARADPRRAGADRLWPTSFRGIESVSYGAQDYLVKGNIDGEVLHRAIRYAVERKRATSPCGGCMPPRHEPPRTPAWSGGCSPSHWSATPACRSWRAIPPGRHQALLGGDLL
jgi:hypothetical protein